MKTLVRFALAALAASSVALSGCAAQGYVVTPVSEETVHGALSGEWFQRDIYDENVLSAVELVYCPIVPGSRTVCRTSVVWKRGETALTKPKKPATPP